MQDENYLQITWNFFFKLYLGKEDDEKVERKLQKVKAHTL